VPRMRTTLYRNADPQRQLAAFAAAPLQELHNDGAGKVQRPKLVASVQATS